MAGGHCDHLTAPCGEKWITNDDKCCGRLAADCESAFDLAIIFSSQHVQVQPELGGRRFGCQQHAFGISILRIGENTNHHDARQCVAKYLELLADQLHVKQTHPGDVSAGPV